MRNVNVSTNSDIRPLLMNFTPASKATVIDEEDYKFIYDPKNQISYFMGSTKQTGSQSATRNQYQTRRPSNPNTDSSFVYSTDGDMDTDD